MVELRDGLCFQRVLVGVNVGLALVDGVISVLAFAQLIRIHSRNSQLGWTRQKVFHLMVGCSNMGSCLYFLLTLISACEGWQCWSHSCGFVFMAFPNIMFFAAFLLLLSFWVDLCHQADDEDDEEDESNIQESLLEKTFNERSSLYTENHRRCLPFRLVHIRSRQRIVILVIFLVFVIMLACAVVIWIGMGKNSIDSEVVARVYVDIFAAATLILAGALACYGIVLCLKMSKVRTERPSSELWKVAGLAVVCVVCFTSRAFVALLTDIPMLHHWHQEKVNDDVRTSLLLILYYFVGSSIPSAFLLWIMREVPPPVTTNVQEESATLTFISDGSAAIQNPQRWTTVTSVSNQFSDHLTKAKNKHNSRSIVRPSGGDNIVAHKWTVLSDGQGIADRRGTHGHLNSASHSLLTWDSPQWLPFFSSADIKSKSYITRFLNEKNVLFFGYIVLALRIQAVGV